MPFREKAKNLFRRKNTDDSLSKTSSSNSSRERWPSNVYKPGEVMPRPKYRKPPTKEHKEHLESFSFGDAWRRKSFQSTYSPMGTRAPSRRNSFISRRLSGRSLGRRSSRANSVKSVETDKSALTPGLSGGPVGRREAHMHAGLAGLSRQPTTLDEAEGDDDVGNVGLSRVQSHEQPQVWSRPRTAEDRQVAADYFNGITAHDHQPFSEHELTLALQRSHLVVPAQG